jgi:hypothetical protein
VHTIRTLFSHHSTTILTPFLILPPPNLTSRTRRTPMSAPVSPQVGALGQGLQEQQARAADLELLLPYKEQCAKVTLSSSVLICLRSVFGLSSVCLRSVFGLSSVCLLSATCSAIGLPAVCSVCSLIPGCWCLRALQGRVRQGLSVFVCVRVYARTSVCVYLYVCMYACVRMCAFVYVYMRV